MRQNKPEKQEEREIEGDRSDLRMTLSRFSSSSRQTERTSGPSEGSTAVNE